MKSVFIAILFFCVATAAQAQKPLSVNHYKAAGPFASADATVFINKCEEVRTYVSIDTQRQEKKGKKKTRVFVSVYKTDLCDGDRWYEAVYAFGELNEWEFDIASNLRSAELHTDNFQVIKYTRNGNEIEIDQSTKVKVNLELLAEKTARKTASNSKSVYENECVVSRSHYKSRSIANEPSLFEVFVNGEDVVYGSDYLFSEIGYRHSGSVTRVFDYGCGGGKG